MKNKGFKKEGTKKLLAALLAVTMCIAIFLPTVNAGIQSNITISSSPSVTLEKVKQNPPTFGTTWNVPDDSLTIQGAITLASDGDIIVVAAGTYYEDQITINKALTIQGAGWASTIIDGGDVELTSAGLVRIIATGDVTFTGFTIQNAGGQSNGGDGNDGLTNIGIYASSGSSSATYTISWNKIIGTNNADDWEDYGLYANGGLEKLIFTHNIVTQAGANSLLIEINPGSTDISYNTIDAGCWGTSPIYYFTYSGNDVTTLQKVSNNTIDVSTGNNPREGDPNINNTITGISFSSAWKGYHQGGSPTDSGKYSNIIISDNLITGVGVWNRGIALDNYAQGAGTGGEISNAIIKGNIFTGTSSPSDWSSSQCFGIRLSGLVTDTLIRDNQITHCCYSFFGRSGFSTGAGSVYPTGTIVHYNVFIDNGYGLRWEGPTALDALYNYWDSSSGPTPTFSGEGVYGNVIYTPYIDTNPPWEVILSYKKQGSGFTWDTTIFGEKISAYDGQDAYDVPKPGMPPTPYIYSYFDAGLSSPYQHLWKDYRRFLHEKETWDLYILSDNDIGSTMNIDISWNLANISSSEYDFVDLYNATNVHLCNMKTQNTYTLVGLADGTLLHLKIKCGVNHIPVAVDDVASVLENSTTNAINVLPNDSDVDGNTLTILSVSTPLHGSATTDGTMCYYTPTTSYHGPDSFIYTISDGFGGTATATVSLTVIQQHTLNIDANWNLISIPCNTSIEKANIMVRYGSTTYTWAQAVGNGYILATLYGWNATLQSYYLADTLVSGQGYWCWAYYDVQFYIWSDAVGSGNIVNLKTHWNIIGLPYETPIDVDDLIIHYNGVDYTWNQAVANNIVLGFVYGWDNNIYTLESTLNPDEGYWMYAYHDCLVKRII